MLWGSSTLSEFRTSLSKVLTLWHCVKVKQRYLSLEYHSARSNERIALVNWFDFILNKFTLLHMLHYKSFNVTFTYAGMECNATIKNGIL